MPQNGEPDYRAILRLDFELNQIQDVDFLLERILLEARRMVNADAGSIYVLETEKEPDESKRKLLIKYAQNDTLQAALPPGAKLPFSVFATEINDKTMSGYCALTKKLLNVPDVYHIPQDAPYSYSDAYDKRSGYKTISTLTFPLVTSDDRLLGVIQMINGKDKQGHTVPFTQEDEFIIIHFAANATVALERAFITRAMILRMIKMAELRDPKETGAHVNRVAGYAAEIYDRWAQRQGIEELERERFKDVFKIAAMLHDVGKVAISDVILKKPMRYSPDEYQIMQRHSLYGALLFDDPQSKLDKIAQEIALTHHENWDGTGYPGWVDPNTGEILKTNAEGAPLGKKGEEIPITGRIVAVADVFDALSSKRAYKDSWPEERVLKELLESREKKFDPQVMDIFFEIYPTIRDVFHRFPEESQE